VLAGHEVLTIGQIEERLRGRNIPFGSLVESILVLAGNGSLAAVQDHAAIDAAKASADRINGYLMDKARGWTEMAYLGSPVSGGGVPVSRVEQLFLLARSQGRQQPREWADSCWQVLASQGQRVIKEGKVVEDPAENLAELTRQATEFGAKKLPILKALSIA
jgi:hypothetical protein